MLPCSSEYETGLVTGIDVDRERARVADWNKRGPHKQPEVLLDVEHIEPDKMDARANRYERDHDARHVEHRLPARRLAIGVWLAAWVAVGDRLGHASMIPVGLVRV